MAQKKISLQVVSLAAVILILVELLTAAAVSFAGFYPLFAIGLARIVEIACMVFILLRWSAGLESVGLVRGQLQSGFRKGIAWSAVFGFYGLVFLGMMHILGYSILHLFQAPVQFSLSGIVSLLLVGGFISPIAEELFFRGIIYGFLRRRSVLLAILASTALFSLAHAITTGLAFVQIIGGLVFAIAYEAEKNLVVPITIHVLGNIAIFILSFVLAA